MKLVDRVLKSVGLQRATAQPVRSGSFRAINVAYQAAQIDRMTEDWVVALLSPDQEIRMALRNLRARARQLAINNPHCKRFLDSAEEQVIGPSGVGLEVAFSDNILGKDAASAIATNIAREFANWATCSSADGQMSLTEQARLWLRGFLADGESFVQHLRGYPHNDYAYALLPVDPDQVDVTWHRLKSPESKTGENEIRMGVEVDVYRRPIAYWLYSGHPSEFSGVTRERVPANQISHAYAMRRVGQTRGVPHMHAAMFLMNMLGEYDKAEVVASRMAACKMAFFVSKTGEEYSSAKSNRDGGPLTVSAEAGTIEELPEGIEPKVVDWQHPSHNYETFSLACLRGIAAGLGSSYATLTGDLRSVNFSSIRQGILSERDSWALMQRFLIDHFYWPVFKSWLPMAMLTGRVKLPPGMQAQDVYDAVLWTPRGWDWVDPYKDVQASVAAIRSGLSTFQRECAKRGLDYKKVFEQRKRENNLASELGLALDLTTSGAGGVQGDTEETEEERGVAPVKTPGTKNPPPPPAKNKNSIGVLRLPE